jgi:transposase
LDGLRTADGRELPPHLRQEIERECRRLWLVVEMIAEVEAEQQQAATAAEAAAAESRTVVQLSRLRGVGPTTANVLGLRSVFQRLQEPPRTRRLFRARVESMEERRREPRSRACRLRQPESAADGARTGLAVAASSAR